jgi:DNA-binding response OmpR family regulator
MEGCAVSGTRLAVIVEDDADIGHLIQGILEMAGIRSLLCATGAAGIAAITDHSPDIVILDIGLPDITGLEVIKRVRAFSNVHIVVLTGHRDLAGTLITAGADAVITKPFRVQTLREYMGEAFGPQLAGQK